MRELDVAEVRRRDEVPEGVRVWSGRWCNRKKAGGVRSRYVVRQYRTEWSEDAFCGTWVGGPFAYFLEWRLSCVGR